MTLPTLLGWLVRGHWRAQPGRTLVAVAAVAVGVALGLGIHLVNDSALGAFSQAIATVNGEADLQIRGRSGLFDEDLIESVAATEGVDRISPVLELTLLSVSDDRTGLDKTPGAADAGRPDANITATWTLPLLALDPFAAGMVTPALMPVPDGAGTGGSDSALFAADAVFLSDAARLRWPGPQLMVTVDGRRRVLRVAGRVPGAAAGQMLAVMDLGSAQWAFGAAGRLSRIDLKFADGANPGVVADRLTALLPAGVQQVTPGSDVERMSNLSRAYRVNLDVLALVALLTGGFIVFASMSLAAVRQQPEMSLLRVLGAPPTLPMTSLLVQGGFIGLIGSGIGIIAGIGLARLLLNTVGGDLGGGYFSRGHDALRIAPATVLAFAVLGLLTALIGAAAPALAARGQSTASWLRAGSTERAWAGLRAHPVALALIVLGIALLAAPAWHGLPIAAYLAIASFLFAGIALVPVVVRVALRLTAWLLAGALTGRPAGWLAITRLIRSPASVAVALAGVVASFALTAAMLIMVSSFRTSVDDWLGQVLPADLYARSPTDVSGAIDPTMQAAIRALPGIERARFQRTLSLRLRPDAPTVTLIARNFGPEPIDRQLPLTGPALMAPDASSAADSAASRRPRPVLAWVSEAMVSRHGFVPGSLQTIPLGQELVPIFVAGVWRDYARQTGAITIDLADFRRITADDTVSEVALWLTDRPSIADADAVIAAVRRAVPPLAEAEFRSAEAIRALSLRIFDRSFAVTYVLEAIALVVGLFGVASTYAAESLNRAREFGMLRHLGVSRAMIVRQLGLEAGLATTIAVLWGGLLGLLIAGVLVLRVNPQSFHWTMDMRLPLGLLGGAGCALIITGVLTAMWASRSASGTAPILAVRSEW